MLFMRFEVTSKNIDVSSSISSNLSVELKQRLKQWSPGELDQALSSINNNSSVDTSGLHYIMISVSQNKKLLEDWLH